MLGGCATAESVAGERAPLVTGGVSSPTVELSMDDVRSAVASLAAPAGFRYEYYQRVERDGQVIAGSLEVPLIRGEQVDGRRRFTAEMGVTLDFGDDSNTRMNLIASSESVCLNVPFYESVLGDSNAPPEFVWRIPLIDGWGCVDVSQLSDTPGLLSIFGFEGPDQFLGVASMPVEGTLVAVDEARHRGHDVQRLTVSVPDAVLRLRFDQQPAGDGAVGDESGVVEASVLVDSAGRLRSVEYSFELGTALDDARVVTERLDVFDHGAVEPIELPPDALDISADVLDLLQTPG